MTETQRKEIQRLRQAGLGYVKIAQTLTLPANTVKSFCQRNPLYSSSKPIPSGAIACPQCGLQLALSNNHKVRRFCSDTCRMLYWTKHQQEIVRKTAVKVICATCGKSFTDYARKARKYCSHTCYIIGRYHGGDTHG